MDSVFESARVWQYITLPRLAIRQSDFGVLSKVFEHFTQSQLQIFLPKSCPSKYDLSLWCNHVYRRQLFSLFDPTQIPNFVAV